MAHFTVVVTWHMRGLQVANHHVTFHQPSCHQCVAFDCCTRWYGLITDSHFTATHENRKYVDLCEHHQEWHKQCGALALRWIFEKDRPSTKTESMCESKNDSEAAGSVWADSPCRRWKYPQTKWIKFQTSVLKPSDAMYCFRYPQRRVSLWSIYLVLFYGIILSIGS